LLLLVVWLDRCSMYFVLLVLFYRLYLPLLYNDCDNYVLLCDRIFLWNAIIYNVIKSMQTCNCYDYMKLCPIISVGVCVCDYSLVILLLYYPLCSYWVLLLLNFFLFFFNLFLFYDVGLKWCTINSMFCGNKDLLNWIELNWIS